MSPMLRKPALRSFLPLAANSLMVLFLSGWALLPVPARAQAQEAPSRSTDQPAIADIQLLVQDWGSREDLDPVSPGETLTLAVGQQVRLRMQAIPQGQHRAPRYPSARFRLLSGNRRVQLSKANEDTGRVLVQATGTEDREPTVVRYEIVSPLNATPDQLVGTIRIDVVAAAHGGAVTDTGDAETETAELRGVTLFEHDDYRGRSELFRPGDAPDLRRHAIGNDRASSVKVDPGCLVELFDAGDLRGDRVVLNQDTPRLSDTPVGSDTISSLRVECGDDQTTLAELPGAMLYSETGFRGSSQHITWDIASLNGSEIGDNQARSIELSPGCMALLYDGAGFRGESTELRASEPDLGSTRIGLDRVTSIRIRCD